jgi:hypothetical protein
MKDERKFEMKFENMKKYMLITISVVLMVSSVACSTATVASEPEIAEAPIVQESEASVSEPAPVESVNAANDSATDEIVPASDGVLTDVEIKGLLFMREEEKLAGDVYRYLYDLWGSSIFQNIARSEDTHTDAVLSLLNQYGIEDPALAETGVFSDPDLQALYDELTAMGSESLKDAFLVGTAIEEIDILDIEEYIEQTDESDIQLVYQNLIAGSENHLRAFVRVLENQTGETFSPQYISQDHYDEIILNGNDAGNSGSGQPGKGNGRRGNS